MVQVNPYESTTPSLEDPIVAWWDGYERGMFHGNKVRIALLITTNVINASLISYLVIKHLLQN
ncbi:MAG: hypothetical protein ACK506_16325 [Pirellula sp.]|jgi:hypothetical protein